MIRNFIVLSLLATSSLLAAPKQPLTHETLWLMPRLSAPIASPDGKWVVFSVSEPAYEEKKEIADLWIVPADGTASPRRITSGKEGESDVAWSPDSRRIAFVTKRGDDEVSQVYLLDVLGGGEGQRITHAPLAARSPRWSPDGKSILFLAAVYPDATDEESNRKKVAVRKDEKSKVRIYDSFPIRRWDKWLDQTQTHLFVIDVPAEPAEGKARDLLAGTRVVAAGFAGRSSEGSKDDLDPIWSPDGRSILFVATTTMNTAAYATVPISLYRVAVAGGEPERLTPDDNSYTHPRFSPDGSRLCFTRAMDAGRIYALDRLACAAWPWTGTVQTVGTSLDRSVDTFAFGTDSRTLYFTAEDSGHIAVYSTSVSSPEVRVVAPAPKGIYTNLTVSEKAGRPVIVATWGSSTSPAEVVRIDPKTGGRQLLTHFNTAKAATIDWQEPREFLFTSERGDRIHNFVVLPAGFDAAKKYPLFVLIHGGAASMWRDSITTRWNYHLIAGTKFIVLLTDYRGSTGYGEKFTLDLLGDPLKGPAEDVNAAADEAIKRYSFIDASRQAAGGASYGGHLANWLEATTTRYKCLVSHAGLANLESQYATSDSIYHRELTSGGPVWEQGRVWREQNPVRYAAHFKTPMLLSVGENDFRVPMNNAIEMFSYLQRQRVPSRLLVWPDENHWILKGENSKVFYSELEAWLTKWLQ